MERGHAMMPNMTLPKEGDLYNIYVVDDHTFEIRYGFYEENERGRVEPLPIFPDFLKSPVYTSDGVPVTSLIQTTCKHYKPRQAQYPEHWCGDCEHYDGGKAEMGRCVCPVRRRE